MYEMDLIPESYRLTLWRLLWVKRFIIIITAVFLCNVACYAGLEVLKKDVQQEMYQLQAKKEINDIQKAELQRLRDEYADYEAQWSLLTALRGGIQTRETFLAVDRSIQNKDLWFLNWKFNRTSKRLANKPETVNRGYFIVVPAGQRQQTEYWKSSAHMTIKGQARNHKSLSEFVQRLFEQSSVENVRIIKTFLRRYAQLDLIDFDLAVTIAPSEDS